MRLPPANGAGCTVFAIAVELTGEDPMKRVVLVSLFLMLAGCVTYEGVDQNGRRSKFVNLIECRQFSIACRRVPQNPKDQASDTLHVGYLHAVPEVVGRRRASRV